MIYAIDLLCDAWKSEVRIRSDSLLKLNSV